MLKTNRNITIIGQSMVGDKQVVYLSATINTDGNSNCNINQNITDKALYDANKDECRKDIADFQGLVYATQDEIVKTTEPTA